MCCGRIDKSRSQSKRITTNNKLHQKCQEISNKPTDKEFKVCNTCYVNIRKGKTPSKRQPDVIRSVKLTHHKCFVCSSHKHKLGSLSASARIDIFVQHNILIPQRARCCYCHLNGGMLKDSVDLEGIRGSFVITSPEVCCYLY